MQNAFPPAEVLQAWNGLPSSRHWTKLGGGFSGAEVWRGGEVVLKRHAPAMSEERLSEIQNWMTCPDPMAWWHGDLSFIPECKPTRQRKGLFLFEGRAWEITTFKAGAANFHADPSAPKLDSAMKILARLHSFWRMDFPASIRLMPAVERRYRIFQLGLDRWRNNRAMLDLIIRPEARDAGLLHLVKRIPALIERERLKLRTIEHLHVECHPCLCDIHHDHLLFTGDKLTGLIDFSAAKIDHPAVDLARLFGSLFPDDKQRWHDAFNMYEGDFPFEWIEILESSGLVGAAIFWFDKLLDNPNPDERVMKRVGEIVARLRES